MLLFGINLVPWFPVGRGCDYAKKNLELNASYYLLYALSCKCQQIGRKVAAPNEKLDISKNNLLVFMYKGEE